MKQRERLKRFFEDNPNKWISLPEILRLGIAQYNARIHELRHEGMKIENKWKIVDGVKHSWFMFTPFEFVDNQGQFSFREAEYATR